MHRVADTYMCLICSAEHKTETTSARAKARAKEPYVIEKKPFITAKRALYYRRRGLHHRIGLFLQ